MGIDGGFLGPAVGECLGTGDGHAALCLQLLELGDIDHTPDGVRFTWREANAIGLVIDPPPHPINPADTKRFIDGLRPREARSTRAYLIKTNQQLGCRGRVYGQPCVKRDGRREVDWRGHSSLRCQCFGPFVDAVSADYAIEYKGVFRDKCLRGRL
ncbi:hypothetical protein D3C84_778750 [compost metagenome]